MIFRFLQIPELTNRKLDDPQTTLIRSQILKKKLFLKNTYKDFYIQFKKSLGSDYKKKKLIELGSGGGFIKEIIPNTITSDIMKLPTVDMSFSATRIPFKNESVDAYFMIDVLHHIPKVELFFKEAERTLKIGGKIILIEPANTAWGGFIYKNFHHEPFSPHGTWKFKTTGPLSGANAAIPWILFFRDRKKFLKKFPSLQINYVKTHTPLRYLISGGFTLRQLLPSFLYPFILGIEKILSPFNQFIGMFYTIEIQKIS